MITNGFTKKLICPYPCGVATAHTAGTNAENKPIWVCGNCGRVTYRRTRPRKGSNAAMLEKLYNELAK